MALITAACTPQGTAIARRFVAEGARLVLADADDARACALAAALGCGAQALQLDVQQELSWLCTLARTLDAHGRLDLLVHDVGAHAEPAASGDCGPPEMPALQGLALGCRQAVRAMRRAPPGAAASMVFIAEPAWRLGPHGALALSARQVAVGEQVRSLAWQCASQRWPVRCNLVQPVLASGQRRPRLCTEGIAAAVLLLAADERACGLNAAELQVAAGRVGMPPARVGASR